MRRSGRRSDVTTVLFACVHSAGRSQMAVAFFNALADSTKARAISAGAEPAEAVHPAVVDAMRVGVDLSTARPRRLTAKRRRLTLDLGTGCRRESLLWRHSPEASWLSRAA